MHPSLTSTSQAFYLLGHLGLLPQVSCPPQAMETTVRDLRLWTFCCKSGYLQRKENSQWWFLHSWIFCDSQTGKAYAQVFASKHLFHHFEPIISYLCLLTAPLSQTMTYLCRGATFSELPIKHQIASDAYEWWGKDRLFGANWVENGRQRNRFCNTCLRNKGHSTRESNSWSKAEMSVPPHLPSLSTTLIHTDRAAF